jgi:hypothetical protein
MFVLPVDAGQGLPILQKPHRDRVRAFSMGYLHASRRLPPGRFGINICLDVLTNVFKCSLLISLAYRLK